MLTCIDTASRVVECATYSDLCVCVCALVICVCDALIDDASYEVRERDEVRDSESPAG